MKRALVVLALVGVGIVVLANVFKGEDPWPLWNADHAERAQSIRQAGSAQPAESMRERSIREVVERRHAAVRTGAGQPSAA